MRFRKYAMVSVWAAILLLLSTRVAPDSPKGPEYRESVIVVGPDGPAEVRHVVLRGSNYEIGRKIGEIAKRDGVRLTVSENRIVNRAKR